MPYSEIIRHGDFGLRTFSGLDGEMSAVDGRFYRFGPDGSGSPVDPENQAQFAVVKHFQTDFTIRLDGPCSLEAVQQTIDEALPERDAMCAVKISACFDDLQFRVMRRQANGTDLDTASQSQAEFHEEGLRGVLVGLRFPSDSAPVGVPGYHLHLVIDDGRLGGHCHGATMSDITIEMDDTDHLHLAADDGMTRLTAGLTQNDRDRLERVERERRT
ncbi:MAG: hypothetical protein CMM46_12845 [Rhodospirillaceae bacterium]|nr:hypothetical protein [Rhodospirillaceae bacterium]|tara:strand:+ start:491 stop:1138 length:648 start_codon:yes stop_codon:yes gene_type:complete